MSETPKDITHQLKSKIGENKAAQESKEMADGRQAEFQKRWMADLEKAKEATIARFKDLAKRNIPVTATISRINFDNPSNTERAILEDQTKVSAVHSIIKDLRWNSDNLGKFKEDLDYLEFVTGGKTPLLKEITRRLLPVSVAGATEDLSLVGIVMNRIAVACLGGGLPGDNTKKYLNSDERKIHQEFLQTLADKGCYPEIIELNRYAGSGHANCSIPSEIFKEIRDPKSDASVSGKPKA